MTGPNVFADAKPTKWSTGTDDSKLDDRTGVFSAERSWDILFVKDNDGDENYNVYAVDPAAKPATGADAPASRDLTGHKGIRVSWPSSFVCRCSNTWRPGPFALRVKARAAASPQECR